LDAFPAPSTELNMGDPQSLIDFVTWAQARSRTHHYYLAIADHADGINGISWDAHVPVPSQDGWDAVHGTDYLTNSELRQALLAISDGGASPIDVLHLDACLMGLLEVAYEVRDTTHYLVTSENLAWSAFAYDRYQATIDAQTTPDVFARNV